jgi:hypothetical protein
MRRTQTRDKVAGPTEFSVDFRRFDRLDSHYHVQLRKILENVPGIGPAARLC